MQFTRVGLAGDNPALYGLITQVGGGAPTIAVISNTIGPFQTSYTGVGNYIIDFTPPGGFDSWIAFQGWLPFLQKRTFASGSGVATIAAQFPPANKAGQIALYTRAYPGGALTDGLLNSDPLAIIIFGRY